MDRKSYEMLAGWGFRGVRRVDAAPRCSGSDDPLGVPEDEVLSSQYYDVSRFDSTIHVTNNTENLLCAQFYVFDKHEQLQECFWPISSNGIIVLDVVKDLLSNPSDGSGPLAA